MDGLSDKTYMWHSRARGYVVSFLRQACRLGRRESSGTLTSPWKPATQLQPTPHGPVACVLQVVFSKYCNSSDIMDLFCIATGLPR